MKVIIQNLGAIQEAEIDLKPFTIFIGPNNAGKTWLAYTLAGIFESYGWDQYARAYASGELPAAYPPLDSAIEKVLHEGSATLNLYTFAEHYGETYFNQVAAFAQHWMRTFMGTQFATFDKMQVSMSLDDEKTLFLERAEKYAVQNTIAGGLLNIVKRSGDETLYIYTSTQGEEPITEKLPAEIIKDLLVRTVTRALHLSLYPQIRVFPTERTPSDLLGLASDEQIVDEMVKTLKQTQERTGMTIHKGFTVPKGYFLNMITAIFGLGSKEIKKRQEDARTDPHIQQYLHLSQMLEKQILAGEVEFSTPEPNPRRDILFQPLQHVSLEMPIASSMAKELSPLVLYLRYLARPGELIIIDEPEMNLHPAAQVKMIEFLSMLVNAGLRLLITTHSSYMLDHLSNLIRAAQYQKADQASITDKFFLKNALAFIPQDDVSVYLIDHGKAENILQEGGKINWGTFGDISDQVASIHYEL